MDIVSREAKIYVRDKKTRKIFHIEEKYSSLVWTERYQECGDFVLEIPLNAANLDVYKIGNYISFDNSLESMVIDSRTINDEFEEPTLEVTGRALSSILMRRVNASKFFELFAGPISYTGDAGDIVESLIHDEIVEPTEPYYWYKHDPENRRLSAGGDATEYGYYEPGGAWTVFLAYNEIHKFQRSVEERKIEKFKFHNALTEKVPIEVSYNRVETLYNILVKIAKNNFLGFRSYFDDDLNIVIELYSGIDRTSSQKTLTPVIFDPVMDNISYIGYLEDATDYKNACFTYSDGILLYRQKYNGGLGEIRHDIYNGYTWYHPDTEKSDVDRFEVPFDVRSTTSVNDLKENVDPELYYGDDPEEGEEGSEVSTSGWSSSDWYEWYDKIQKAVKDAGIAEYEEGEYHFIQSSEGAIDPLVRYTFETDYNIGDKVDITNGDYGIAMTAYIDEAVKTYDNNGWIITPNFKNILDYDYGEENEDGSEEE